MFGLGPFLMFFNVLTSSLFCSPRLHSFDQKYNKNRNIVEYNYNLKQLFSMWISVKIAFIPTIKAVFSASLLQSSVSHDPSEIIIICWFNAQETFLIINNVENDVFVEIVIHFLFFRIHKWIKSSKELHLFDIEIFWNIINVFYYHLTHPW